MKKLIVFTVLVSAVTLAGFWGGKKVCMLMWPGSVNPSQAWYFNLGLSPEQAESLKNMDSAFRSHADKFCTRICKERLELLQMLREPQTPTDAVYRKIEEIGAMQVALEKEIATHILTAKETLSPEQSRAYLDRIQHTLEESIRQSGYREVIRS